ncbi:MAG: hypothetical protein H0U76_07895 [Ktedonobacteraceae bacterium]|nr:hypothetical protein [Ktedonobacteraceae bacterium]
MQAEEILTQVKTGTGKQGWVVFPLLREKLMWAIAGWIFGILIGLLLLAVLFPIVVPYNYERGIFSIILTSVLLGVLAAVVIGSIVLLIVDVRRLLRAHEHVIVITYEDFVKQEGDKIIQVPLSHVQHVTSRGRSPLEQNAIKREDEVKRSIGGRNVFSTLFGRKGSSLHTRRRRMRAPTSLAFLDARDDTEVIVVSDDAFGDPFVIANTLKEYATSLAIVERSEM